MTKAELLDGLMKTTMTCPFYGKETGGCDVGRGYISISVVHNIAHHCSSRYAECATYGKLFDREAKPQSASHADRHPEKPEMTGGDMSQTVQNRGWIVTLAGTAINLALGILYTWSVFKGAIKASIEKGGAGSFQWDLASINDPYAVCCLVFAFAMVVAGKCQDRVGPRATAMVGALLVGAGFFWISQTTDYVAWVLGFGVLAGTGIGFGYSSATPPALKWFPPARTGLVAGLVVSGFGLASVYIAPLATWLLRVYGLQQAMLFFGIMFLFVVSGLSMLLTNPPKGYVPATASAKGDVPTRKALRDYTPSEILKTPTFYLLWLLFFIGSGAGLMVIGSVAGMAKASLGEMAFLAVAIMAVGNAGGRIVAGLLSDRIGRARTLFVMMACQALMMFAAIPIVGSQAASPVLLVVLATFIGFNYGTNLSLFPSFAKDLWGLKNFGTNYGVLFSAWGVGGFVMSRVSEMLQARSAGSFDSCFIAAGLCLILAAALALKIKTREQLDAQSAAMMQEPHVQQV